MKRLFFQIRFFLAKSCIDIFIFGYVWLVAKRGRLHTRGSLSTTKLLFVFQVGARKDFSLSLLSLLSLYYFVPAIRVTYIDDGTLLPWQRQLLRRLTFPLEIFEKYQVVENQLRSYPNCLRFFRYAWSGKKLFVPILLSKKNPFLILDTDTIFLRRPKELEAWMQKPVGNIYMVDYKNFQVISPLEAQAILGKKPNIKKLNTGLVGVDSAAFWKHLTLKDLEKYIGMILECVKERMTYDYFVDDELYYVYHLLEQTVYWLAFEHVKSKALPLSYFLCNQREGENLRALLPKTFVHFAGDVTRKTHYRYLFLSLKAELSDKMTKKPSTVPWYLKGNKSWE